MGILAKWLAKRKGNDVPFAVVDTVNALWEQDKRPILIRKSKTDTGYEMVFHMPRNMAFDDFVKKEGNFRAATGCKIVFNENGKALTMKIIENKLDPIYEYTYSKVGRQLGIPLGISVDDMKQFIFDLVDAPHVFVNGPTRKGKSNLLRLIATHLQLEHNEKSFTAVIDYGAADFMWLEDNAVVVTEIEDARKLLIKIERERVRREAIMKKARVNKMQKLDTPFPYIVLIIDEWLDMMEDEVSIELLSKIQRKGAKQGIHIIAGTQRLDSKCMKQAGMIKNNFPVRISFKVDRVNSDMVLGCDAASKLPKVKGRFIFMDSDEPIEVQAYLIEPEDSEKLIKSIPAYQREVFTVEQSPVLLPPR